MSDFSLDALREALREDILAIACDITGAAPSKRYRGAVRFGGKGALNVNISGPYAGSWKDFDSDQGGDAFALIQWKLGCNFADAVAWGRRWLGWPEEGTYKAPDEQERIKRLQVQAAKKAKQEASIKAYEQRRIKRAREIWDRSIPAKGTLAEAYILKTRAIPLNSIPDCIRFDPVDRTAVFAATTADGTVQAVQQVYLTAEGTNQKDKAGDNKKLTRGLLDGSAVRLAGRTQNGPVCLAEGPETGLSVWVATGNETWITLGANGIPKAQPPKGVDVVVCHDDDPPNKNRRTALKEAKTRCAEAGNRVFDAWPTQKRLRNKSDFNDVLKSGGIAAVQARFDHIAQSDSVIGSISITASQAQQTLASRIADFFAEASDASPDKEVPVHGITVTVGGGKTQQALQQAARKIRELRTAGDKRAIVFAVPEHQLSEQIKDRLHEIDPTISAEVLRGRDVKKPNAVDAEDRMCGAYETVREAVRLLADIDKEVCLPCPFFAGCSYQAQKDLDADIWIVAHQRLFNEAPAQISRRGIFALIVDESPWQAGVFGTDGKGIEVPLDWMNDGSQPTTDGQHGSVKEAFKRAFERRTEDGPVKRQELIDSGLQPQTQTIRYDGKTRRHEPVIIQSSASQARAAEWRRKIEEGPWQQRTQNASIRKMTLLWDAVDEDLNGNAVASGRLYYHHNDEGIRCIRVCGRRDVHESWQVPTLLIDATLAEDLVRFYWPQIKITARIDIAAPYQRIYQAADRSFSKKILKSHKNQALLKAFICARHRERGGKTLVVGNKDFVTGLNLPDDIQTAWFNALAGHNQFKAVRTLIVIGRPLPPHVNAERMAGALSGTPPHELKNANEGYDRTDIVRLMRCGGGYKQILGEGNCHPDPIAETIRSQIADGQIIQAIGRARGIWRTEQNPVDIFVLSDAVLPVPVDGFLQEAFVFEQSQEERMLAEGGIAFYSAAAAAKAYPALYRTQKAAEHALARSKQAASSMSPFPYKKPLYGFGEMLQDRLAEVFYRKQGPSYRRERALVDLRRILDPRTYLEGLLGPLAEFELLNVDFEADSVAGPVVLAPPIPPVINPPPVKQGPSIVLNLDGFRAAIRDSHTDMGALALKLGVSLPHLSNMLRGRRRMTPEFEVELIGHLEDCPKLQGRLL